MRVELAEKNLKDLSPHLFWDVDRNAVLPEVHQKFIIQRVLEYGTLNDWQTVLRFYGRETIIETARTLRSLDPRALAFIAVFSGIPREHFRCYTTK